MNNKFNELLNWLEFAIKNQEGLRIETEAFGFSEWDRGYLRALKDIEIEVKKYRSECRCGDKYHEYGAICL